MKRWIAIFLFPWFCFGHSVAESNNQFAFSFFSRLEQQKTNQVFSPFGIFSNLALLYLGAEGDTKEQFQSLLYSSYNQKSFLKKFQKRLENLTQSHQSDSELLLANVLFARDETQLLPSFKKLVSESFQAKIQRIDPNKTKETAAVANDWIQDKTKGKITDLISSEEINPFTRLIAANVVYFKANWLSPFQRREGDFFSIGGEKKQTQMLEQVSNFEYDEDEAIQAIVIPFASEISKETFFKCLLVLPKGKEYTPLSKILEKISFSKILLSLRTDVVQVTVPKFCMFQKIDLKPILQSMGLKDAFDVKANFSRMDGIQDLYLNKIFHQTYFSFQEYGIKATSASAIQLGIKSAPISANQTFLADHPFFFFLLENNSNRILFMGQTVEPNLEICNEI